MLKRRDILQGISRDGDNIGKAPGCDRAEILLLAQELGAGRR
jgi:hypothetical protein